MMLLIYRLTEVFTTTSFCRRRRRAIFEYVYWRDVYLLFIHGRYTYIMRIKIKKSGKTNSWRTLCWSRPFHPRRWSRLTRHSWRFYSIFCICSVDSFIQKKSVTKNNLLIVVGRRRENLKVQQPTTLQYTRKKWTMMTMHWKIVLYEAWKTTVSGYVCSYRVIRRHRQTLLIHYSCDCGFDLLFNHHFIYVWKLFWWGSRTHSHIMFIYLFFVWCSSYIIRNWYCDFVYIWIKIYNDFNIYYGSIS